MKISKELKYNILVIIILIIVDFSWDIFTSSKKTLLLSTSLLLTITFSISFFSIYLINYYYFLPKLLDTKKYLLFILSIVLMILAFAGIRFLLEEIVSPFFFNIHNYNLDQEDIVFVYLTDSFIYAFKACLYSSIMYLLYKYNKNKNSLHQLNLKHQQAQLAVLKSQISPHFLFNTLNNFYVELYDEKPKIANDILKLSHLLRYVTYEASQDFMPLEKELIFINDYLHFFKRRYEDNFHVELQIYGTIKGQQVPSLILIHFVENVCKHGIINDKNRIAKIEINIQNNQLEVITINHINTSEKYMDSGIGTDNIEKRLQALFNNNYTLEYQKNDTIFKTNLKLPI